MKGVVKRKKRGIRDEVVQKANGGFEGSVKQMRQEISGLVKKNEDEGETGVATLRDVDGNLVSNGKG